MEKYLMWILNKLVSSFRQNEKKSDLLEDRIQDGTTNSEFKPWNWKHLVQLLNKDDDDDDDDESTMYEHKQQRWNSYGVQIKKQIRRHKIQN
jgi:hypothetical protein